MAAMARARNTCPPAIWALWWPPWRAAPTRWPCTSMAAASFRGAMDGGWTGENVCAFFFSHSYVIWYERYEIIPWHIGWLTVVCATVIPFKWRLKIPSPQLIVWLWENRPSFVDWELVFQAGSILLEGIQPGFSEFLRSYYHIPGYSQSFGTMIGFGRHTWGTLLLWNWSAGPSHVATTFMRHLIIAKFESHKVLMLCFGAFEMCSMGQWT